MTFENYISNGVLVSPEDPRDYPVAAMSSNTSNYPDKFIWTPLPTRILDQGNTNMCVAYSLKYVKDMLGMKNANPDDYHSFSFIYANRENGDYEGEGMYPREALKNLTKYGTCLHSTFSQTGTYNNLKNRVTDAMRKEALNHGINGYARCYTSNDIMNALMNVSPVVVSYPIYNNFLNGHTVIEAPNAPEQIKFNHQVVIVGWEKLNGKLYWVILNSWGTGFGNNGYAKISEDYPSNEAWCLTDSLEVKPQQVVNPVTNNTPKAYYRVLVVTTAVKKTLQEQQWKLKTLTDRKIYLDKKNGYDLLYCGTFTDKNEAVKFCNYLKSKGLKYCSVVFN